MSARDFLDTNVLVYSYLEEDPRKQKIGQELVLRTFLGECIISAQVLVEFATALLHKISPRFTPKEVIGILDTLSPIPVLHTDEEMVRRAIAVKDRYGVHYFDGMIIAAAERAGCRRIWSEDLNAGQEYFGIRVQNPFAE